MRTTTLYIFSLAADVTGSSTQCRSLRITQSNTCSRRRSESSALRGQIARLLFAFPAPCVFLFVFLPRNELSGGTPTRPTRHAHTHFSTSSIQADTHALTYTHNTHRRLLCKRRCPRRCSFFIGCCCCCWTSWTKEIPVVAWCCAELKTELLPPLCIMRGCR